MVSFAIGGDNLVIHKQNSDSKSTGLPSAIPSLFLVVAIDQNVILEGF
jgi:hypothetical protein